MLSPRGAHLWWPCPDLHGETSSQRPLHRLGSRPFFLRPQVAGGTAPWRHPRSLCCDEGPELMATQCPGQTSLMDRSFSYHVPPELSFHPASLLLPAPVILPQVLTSFKVESLQNISTFLMPDRIAAHFSILMYSYASKTSLSTSGMKRRSKGTRKITKGGQRGRGHQQPMLWFVAHATQTALAGFWGEEQR